jgi:hypothetical protein
MKKFFFPKVYALFCLLLLNANTMAETLPQSKMEFCSRFVNPNTQETIQNYTLDPINLMSFKNSGGLFNGGVCWWHSRFQRNVLYLGIFRPDLPRSSEKEDIYTIIKQIRKGKSVVTFPGYANFFEFSKINQELIQRELNDWQLYDGVVLGSWRDGLKGHTTVEASQLRALMNEVYDYVTVKKKIAYEKLQIKGVTSHAWLIVGMKEMADGFEVGYLDSNSPQMSKVYSYKFGDQSFFKVGYGNFVPYLEFKKEEERILLAAKTYCGISSALLTKDDEADYEEDLNSAKQTR